MESTCRPCQRPMYRLIAHFGTAAIDEFVENFVRQARSLVAWLDGEIDDHPGDGRHRYAALEIPMAIYESTRPHEVTRLPLATRVNPLDLLVHRGLCPCSVRAHMTSGPTWSPATRD